MPQEPKYPVLTVIKSAEIINYLSTVIDNRGVSITELSKRLAIGKSTVHRILDTLLFCGYVEKNGETNCYRLGWRLYSIGQAVPQQNQIAALDKQILIDVAERTSEIVNLGVLRGAETVIISQVDGSVGSLRVSVQPGTVEPVYATALGKVILSGRDDSEIISLAKTLMPFELFTNKTVTNEKELLAVVHQAEKRGYALDNEEYTYGLVCMACPVRDYTGKIIAAISVSMPAARYNKASHARVLSALRDGTKNASYALGYRK